ncbi:DUF5906 domain-containing protein [Paraburkholderia domus]|uniref:DUF5906 domain-containing protein n=1 Tax=Paraburkholderia domus TaxID=2793075 RepID=UPI001AFCE9EF|nr:DUF5906 domain-containing protein [Paraburkholderia domus]CAE6747697.1 hypothetical protein R75483_02974 [Paraburkholderia domus]
MTEFKTSYSDRPLAFSLFAKLTETTPQRTGDRRWPKARRMFESHFANPHKDRVPGFSPVRFKPGTTRADINVVALSCLVLDLDDVPLDAIRGAISQYEWVAHSTHSHTPARHCSRVILPLMRDVFPAEWSRFWLAASRELTGGLADKACKDLSRFYYLPSVHPERASDAFHEHNEGTWLNPDAFLDNLSAAATGADPSTVNSIAGVQSQQAAAWGSNLGAGKVDLDADISEGSRNDGLTRVAGHFAHAGLTGEDLFERVQAHNVARCKPPLDRQEVRKICSSVSKREAQARATAAVTFEAALLGLNEQFAWIQTPPAIWRIASREFIPVAAFKIEQGNQQFLSGKTYVDLGTAWLKWPERRQHPRLAFEPQEPAIMTDGALNLWEGFAFAPAAGDAGPWLNLMAHLFPDPSACRWIQQWLAHSIQHPGTKKHSAIVCWSREQGLGKNLVFEAFARLFGRHACVAQPGQLGKQFNAWMRDKLNIISDETGRHGNQQAADLIKTWITSSEIATEQKNQPSVVLRNVTDFIFLGNNADAVHLSAEDRRFSVFEITSTRLPDGFYRDFANWRDSAAGLPALLHHLQTLDLNGFDPKGHAPMTSSKRAMIDASRSGPEQWLLETFVSGAVAQQHGRELFSAVELCLAYEWSTKQKATVEVMGRALSKSGIQNKRVRLAGAQPVVYALDNHMHWSQQLSSAWAIEAAKPSKLPGTQ